MTEKETLEEMLARLPEGCCYLLSGPEDDGKHVCAILNSERALSSERGDSPSEALRAAIDKLESG